jgi:hypothetical protein
LKRINIVLELACRDDERQAPFKKIVANPSDFIEAEYLPTGTQIRDPRSMRLDSLIKFFKHVTQREASHGIPNAFRFKAVLSSRKLGTLHPASYRHDGDESDRENNPIPLRRKRRKPTSTSGNAPMLNPDISEEPNETNNTARPANEPAVYTGVSTTPATGVSTTPATGGSTTPVAHVSTTPATAVSTTPATNTVLSITPSRCSRVHRLSIVNTGLHTPEDTPAPDRIESPSPPPRNRGRKTKQSSPTKPIGTPANSSSLTEPRRSQRTSGQGTPSTLKNLSPKKKTQKKKKKNRR